MGGTDQPQVEDDDDLIPLAPTTPPPRRGSQGPRLPPRPASSEGPSRPARQPASHVSAIPPSTHTAPPLRPLGEPPFAVPYRSPSTASANDRPGRIAAIGIISIILGAVG